MGRQPCCDKIGLKRGAWTIEEDQKLINFILNNGIHCWRLVPKLAGLMRCGKSCRLRWTNYLRPDLKRGAFSEAEEEQIIELHSRLGNRWSKIASHFPGRTDNEIKNHWNTRIKKRLKLQGLDPLTHEPLEEPKMFELEEGNNSQFNPSIAEHKSIETASIVGNAKEVVEMTQNGVGFGSEKSKLVSLENLNVEEVKAQPNYYSSSCSTSFSLDDTLYPSSMGGESGNYEGSYLGWKDAIDSFSSWDELYNLQDVFSFGTYP